MLYNLLLFRDIADIDLVAFVKKMLFKKKISAY